MTSNIINSENDRESANQSAIIVLTNSTALVYIYRYALSFLFLFGFLGNLASAITFLQPTLHNTSTGGLLLILAVFDTIFLMISIFDYVEVGLVNRAILTNNYDDLCRFRWFVKNLIQFCTAWILVMITVDRWLRTRFPFKVNTWCTRRNFATAVLFIVIIGIALHSHMLIAQFFAGFIPGIATYACGPIDRYSSYGKFYFVQWPILQVFLACLIPAVLMSAFSVDIYRTVQKNKFRIQPVQLQNLTRQERLQRHMLTLMTTSILIFFITTLPVSLRRIAATHDTSTGQITDLTQTVQGTAILTLLLTLNYTINFYVHCLTSKLFRKEFLQWLKILVRIHHIRKTTTVNDILHVELHRRQLQT